MDAGARGRRLLQRREYAAKISGSEDRVPKELEDHVVYEQNPTALPFADTLQKGVKALDKFGSKVRQFDKNRLGGVIKKVFGSSNPGSNYTPGGKVTADSYQPEGEMVEANAEQMKAMHDAKMKKKEDDKVKEKKKVDEACWKGYEKKGMKTMFGKRYPNCVKKTKKEEVQLEAKKSCGEGEYYCHDRKKCMPIPKGAKVGKDGMLVKEDMKGMSQKSGDKRSTESGAGMTAKGVAKYNRRTGGNLKTAVTTPPSKLKPGSKAAKRRKSFCARSKSWTGPRGKAARRRWNCSYEPELPMIIDEKKLYNGAPLSDRVAAWAKKINEGTLVRGNYGPYISGQTTKKVKKIKIDPTKPLPVAERKMTTPEKKKKEDYVKGMKKDKKGFTKRYGKDGESVMYATATKMAMKKEAVFNDPKLNRIYSNQPRLTRKGVPAFRNTPDPDIFHGSKKIGGGMVALAPKKTDLQRGITAVTGNQKRIDNLMKQLNSYEPEGQMIEAKIDSKMYGKNATGKTTLRNMRRFDSATGHGDSPQRRDETQTRRDEHKKRRGMKEDLVKETPFGRDPNFLDRAKEVINRYNRKLKKNNDAINKVLPNSAGFEKKPINLKTEGSLHSWFKGSKSKDGKPGWVNVVTGGTCASDKPGEGTPKCVSSSKRASMTKAERLSASRRKKKADPGQQSKSGAAKPTYVATDSKKKK